MSNFLIVYNRRTGESQVKEYGAGHEREAIRERFVAERKYRGSHDIEVVVLSSDSVDELERTHSRYFHDAQQLAEAGGR